MLPRLAFPDGGRAADIGLLRSGAADGFSTHAFDAPSVTDLSAMPWKVPLVSILKPSVSFFLPKFS